MGNRLGKVCVRVFWSGTEVVRKWYGVWQCEKCGCEWRQMFRVSTVIMMGKIQP